MAEAWATFTTGTVICLSAFMYGVRMILRTDQAVDRLPGGAGRGPSLRQAGRVLMVAAPLFWLLWAAICFGLLGPILNIQPIQLH